MTSIGEWWRFDQWQAELETEMLREKPAGTPFTLFIDEAELDRLFSSQAHQALHSLVRAVASKCEFHSRSDFFQPIKRLMASWYLGDRAHPPPCLPLLTLTVIAATEMRVEGEYRASAFYPRLVELMSRAGVKVERLQLSDSFDDVPSMWEALARWLEFDGQRGILTLTQHKKFTRIGYSLSQAIIRGSDRARLTTFFDSIGLPPSATVDKSQLLTALRLWSTRDRGFTKQFVAALNSDEAVELVLPTLVSLAGSWDGLVVATGGRRFMLVSLVLDLDEWSVSWGIKVQRDLDEDLLALSNGTKIAISASDDGYTLYSTQGEFPAVRNTVGQRFDAEGRLSFAMYKPKDVTVLAYDLREARWVETTGIEPFTECVLVVNEKRYHELESVLRKAADKGWVAIKPGPIAPLIPGHVIVRNVSFSDSQKFKSAMLNADPNLGDEIRPDPAPVPRLVNGLKVDLGVSARDHYIAGGEPDLILPLGIAPRQVDVSLNGFSQKLTTSDFPVPLRAVTPLDSGKHTLVVDGRTLIFHVIQHVPDVTTVIPSEKATTLADWTELLHEAPSKRRSAMISIHGNTTAWAVDYTGCATKVECPPIPLWFAERAVGQPTSYEPEFDDRVAWLVRTNGTAILSIDRISIREPHFRHLDASSDALWQLISKLQPSRYPHVLLPIYVKAWRAQRNYGT